MKIKSRKIKFTSAVVLLTAFLTWFFYAHEPLSKPLRAATALIETPVAIASGLSHYLNLGIPVYDSIIAITITNLIASIIIVTLGFKLLKLFKNSAEVNSSK